MNKTSQFPCKTVFLLILVLFITSCSNPVKVNTYSDSNQNIFSKDSIDPKLPEIIVWQIFRDPENIYESEYRAVQMDEGYFITYDSITIEPRDTLYNIGFEIEWNTHKHIYTLNKINYSGTGWTALDLKCSRKYNLIRSY